MNRTIAAVREQLRHEDVVPVRPPGRIREGLAPAAPLSVHLMIGGLHGIDQF